MNNSGVTLLKEYIDKYFPEEKAGPAKMLLDNNLEMSFNQGIIEGLARAAGAVVGKGESASEVDAEYRKPTEGTDANEPARIIP